jgi:5'-nucleotidase
MTTFKITALSLLTFLEIAFASGPLPVSIVVSGESHGMVEGCECVRDPGGGLARRSFIIKQMREKGTVLLLDAGGFAAGGMYDSYTEGRSSDSIRSSVMIKGMGYLQYDAVALGDDDLQYDINWLKKQIETASLPVISANCFTSKNQSFFKKYVLVKKGAVTFGITALTSDEYIIETDKNVEIKEPLQSLKEILPELVKKSDIQIVLSHLGNEMSEKIVAEYPEIDLVVNGHRKQSDEPLYLFSGKPVMQFGFQGKSLSLAEVRIDQKKMKLLENSWVHLDPSVPEDSSTAKQMQYVLPSRKDVYDLYIMSQCPYGLDALKSLMSFQRSFPYIQFNIWFIGSIEKNGDLRSLHGESEIKEEMLWLGVKSLYPNKWSDFLFKRSQTKSLSVSIFNDLGIDLKTIEDWVFKNGKVKLKGHYQRSIRLSVDASPSLYINNIPYEETVAMVRLAKLECTKNGKASSFCDSLPACLEDRDCKMNKKVGKCIDDTCTFIDAAQFTFTALVNDSMEDQPQLSVIKTTEELFPGAVISIVSIHAAEGSKLLKKWGYPPIPFFKFGKEVQYAYNFNSVEEGLIPFDDGFTFKREVMNCNYFPKRKLTLNEIVVFIDPFFKGIGTCVDLLNAVDSNNTLRIQPIIFSDPADAGPGTIELFREDEAFRWLSITSISRDGFKKYLSHYAQNPGNSQWPLNAKAAGIDPDTITALMQSSRKRIIDSYYSDLVELSLDNPLYILRNNKELIAIKSEKELRNQLQKISR